MPYSGFIVSLLAGYNHIRDSIILVVLISSTRGLKGFLATTIHSTLHMFFIIYFLVYNFRSKPNLRMQHQLRLIFSRTRIAAASQVFKRTRRMPLWVIFLYLTVMSTWEWNWSCASILYNENENETKVVLPYCTSC